MSRESRRADEIARGYTTFQRRLNYVGLAIWISATCYVMFYLHNVAVEHAVDHAGWIVTAAILCAWPLADFITGLVHWAADNWGSEEWPVVGGFVKPFRNHHVDPEDITHHGFFESHGDHFIATLPCFWWALCDYDTPSWALFFGVMYIFVALWVVATAKFHAWAHTKEPSLVVRVLQRARIILSPAHHDVHHKAPHATNYCITNGWMNAPLRWLRFFRILEWLMTTFTGAIPRHRRATDAATTRRSPT